MKRILFLLLLTVSVYGQNPSRFAKIQITGNANSGTATKVNVQEANGEVNSQTINTGFNKNIGLGGSDVVGANTLLNQYSTTPLDWTATAFNSGQVVFYGGKQWLAKMATVAGDVPAVSSKWEEITFEALANKTVIVDATPTDGSNNAVSSNAVFDGLALKSNIGHTHVASQITDLSKASVGLGNVDNTSDLLKPISTATQNALNGKENSFTKNTAFNKNFGTTAGTVVEGGTLGSNAYTSTAYLPLTGGTINANNETINYKVSSNNGAIYNSWYDFNNNRISFLGFGGGTQSNATFFVASENGGNIALTTTGVGKVVVQSLSGTGTRTVVADASGILSAPDIPTAPTAPAGTNTTQIATTAFVLANSSARPYKVYTALLSQTGTNAPTATVLENTLGGTVTWGYSSTGNFTITTSGLFPIAKIHTVFQMSGYSSPIGAYSTSLAQRSTSIIDLKVINGSSFTNNFEGFIEIRAYP